MTVPRPLVTEDRMALTAQARLCRGCLWLCGLADRQGWLARKGRVSWHSLRGQQQEEQQTPEVLLTPQHSMQGQGPSCRRPSRLSQPHLTLGGCPEVPRCPERGLSSRASS